MIAFKWPGRPPPPPEKILTTPLIWKSSKRKAADNLDPNTVTLIELISAVETLINRNFEIHSKQLFKLSGDYPPFVKQYSLIDNTDLCN